MQHSISNAGASHAFAVCYASGSRTHLTKLASKTPLAARNGASPRAAAAAAGALDPDGAQINDGRHCPPRDSKHLMRFRTEHAAGSACHLEHVEDPKQAWQPCGGETCNLPHTPHTPTAARAYDGAAGVA